jgi:murein L,D-transpeptidase YcbB/YkuD
VFTCSRRAALLMAAALAGIPARAEQTGSVTALAAKQGKAVTRTEILAGSIETPMLTLGSIAAMEQAIAMYRDIVRNGGWPELPAIKLAKGDKRDEVILLRHRLIREGYQPVDALAVERPEKFDGELDLALRAFQANHGLGQSGKLDARTLVELNVPAEWRLSQLEANYPRIARHLDELGPRYILVNVPSAQLETVSLGTVYSRHNIVAGKPSRPTPALNAQISEINFNPYWNAPASIVQKDLIPKLIADPRALEAMQIRVFDGIGGPEIDPMTVDWSTVAPDRYFFRQDPGGQNAMASLKINFQNRFHVYLHDTPHKELFGEGDRYQSSGCIRVDKVHVLVDWILAGQDGFDLDYIEEIAASGERHDVSVRNRIDVRLMYLTAWASEDGRVQFRPDVYQLDGTGFVDGQPEPVSGI